MSKILGLSLIVLCIGLRPCTSQGNRVPTLVASIYFFTPNEEEPAGTELTRGIPFNRILATDPDNDPIEYLIPQNTVNSNLFDINATTGVLYFQERLDRDTPAEGTFSLIVEISDRQFHGVGVVNPQVEVTIVLQDINDNAPTFGNLPSSTSFSEDTDVPTVIYNVQAMDRDVGSNAQVDYSISAVNGVLCLANSTNLPCSMFAIDVNTGTVTLEASLDYDVISERTHSVSVRAQDRGALSFIDVLTVVATDVNDLNPAFDLQQYAVDVHENLTYGASVIRVRAYDQDTGVNDNVLYTISAGNMNLNGNESFAIDNATGLIFVSTANLDRETHQEYNLVIQATEEMDSTRFATTQVKITVFDINDHAPFFDRPFYSANVSEGAVMGTAVVIVTAMDRDTGVHAEFQFTLENAVNDTDPLPFSIEHDVNSGEGTIVLNTQVDFESRQSYSFIVVATETVNDSPMSGVTMVTVSVLNENDNNPLFGNDTYFATIPENVDPGANIAIVFARDNDIGTFGQVEFSIASGVGAENFNITTVSGSNNTAGGVSGLVGTAVRLDYEDRAQYVLQISAEDLDQNPSTRNEERATLIVDVINQNDNPPMFVTDVPRPQLDVTEEQLPPVVVYAFTAVDADGDLTPLTFEIVEGNELGAFMISGNNLVTVRDLDFDLVTINQTYTLRVIVNDTVNDDDLTLDIQVIDINDNSPVLDNSSYSFAVYENLPVGSLVGQVFADDQDSGTYGQIVYTLTGPGSESFTINRTSGVITTATSLNRETRPQPFELVVTATDQDMDILLRNSGSSQVIVTTLDQNDNAPRFDPINYIFNVPENTDFVSLAIRATDDDLGPNSVITYDIAGGNVDYAFVIDGSTGVISRNTTVYLDHERVTAYLLNVTATDGGSPFNSASDQVIINIIDENDVVPTFDQTEYNSTIREDLQSNSIVRQLVASDADSNENGQLTYTITSVTGPLNSVNAPDGTFLIDESSGTIRTIGSFDREAFEGPYTVMVLVRDGGFPVSHNSTTSLLVYISDANDNRPIFQPDQYSNSLSENLPPGHSVVTVTATDRDMPGTNNSYIVYSISDVFVSQPPVSSDPSTHFSINASTGVVSTTVELDYEAIRSYRITVEAADRGNPQRSSNAIVMVTALDENDQSPEFSMDTYNLNVAEDTPINTRFQVVTAIDLDTPPNAIIEYSSSLASPFRIDPSSGELILTSTLDFENTTVYTFVVTATNAAGGVVFSDNASVVISVTDVNDRIPVFNQEVYMVTVPEGNYTNNPQQLSVMLVADDDDFGVFGDVAFDLLLPGQDSDLWQVQTISNGRGRMFAVGYLDRESVDSYIVTVQARDGGNPAATATAVVRITIEDVNDITPQLNRDSYSASVQEGSQPGQVIARVSAMDGDAGSNGEVILSIDDIINFDIDPDTGEIVTVVEFDFETDNMYTVIITASDNSTLNPLSSMATLSVNITDANDNAPKFVSIPVVPNLSEDMPVGTDIATLSATDSDSGSNQELIYQLSNGEGQFSIDSDGVVTISSPLDREVRDKYNLTVTVLDRGQPQMADMAFLPFTITDVNDVPPDFERDAYNFVVPENVPVSSTVGTVVAVDTDTTPNSFTTFSIEGDVGLFRIQRRELGNMYFGDILNINNFDYETQSSFTLRVRSFNTAPPGWERYTNVTVSIRDLNDNPPVFPTTSYSLTVSESAPVGTPVGTLVATDRDGGINGTVVYSFGPSTPSGILSRFALGNESGVLTLAGALDFEANQSFSFSVVASDRSVDPMSSSVTVNVGVQDTNEGAPAFSLANYIATVDENLAAGALVVVVNATEQDATSIEYSIVTGNTQRFAVHPSTGVVTTSQMLDREEQDRYILTVQARDMGAISLSSFTQVDVSVTDRNDNSPDFQDPLQFFLREDAGVGASVGTLVATDRDAGTNGEVSYSSPDSGPFTIRPDGEIVVANPGAIDFETTPTWTIIVMATDGANPPNSDSTPIQISLIDVNDNSPVFDQPAGYVATVPENSDVGISILTVRAADADGDTPTYTIISGDDPAPKFSLDPQTGLVQTTVNRLDREALVARQFMYTLNIQASDQRDTERTTLVTLTITVTDVNDLAPQCAMDPFEFNVDEGNDNVVRFGVIETSDGDFGTNAIVRYSIAGGDPSGLFSIDPNTGDIFGLPTLDFETVPIHFLSVAAVDQAVDPRDRMTSTCMVTVILRDVNDNRPSFSSAVYESSVLENSTRGVDVTQVSATDLDSGVNGDVFYSFQTPIREFSIDQQTGLVTVSGSLDAETTPMYELELEVRDGGSPTRIGLARLVVRVVDINDNSPRFDRSFYSVTIGEDQPMNSDVITLEAADPDSPALLYSIESGNNGIYFSINPTTGLIQTARALDREQVAVFTLQVAASDEDSNIGRTTLQISLMDVNDEAPIFLQPSYYARVPENSPAGTQVLPVLNMSTIRIEAFDSDEANTQNSRVLYSLEGPNADRFDINFNTGIVTVTRGANLDHEAMSMITITVVASDSVPTPGTRSSSVDLLVEVVDENDESPTFTQPFGYAIPISEGTDTGEIITTSVRATDPDGGDGGVVRYSITGATPRAAAVWFEINATTGDITLIQTLDREMNNVITLTVIASDLGQPALMSVVSVQVTVTDVNDNPPEFSQDIYTATVPEFLAVGSSAFQVFASDSDVGSNAAVEFEVVPPSNRFTVNPSTGIIATTGPLDHEMEDTHSFTVQACDSGVPRLCSSALVTINVGDFNDEVPKFDLDTYTVDVCDDALLGLPLVQPVATDRDSGSNAAITYSLVGDVWGLFLIDPSTGLISLQRDIGDVDVDEGMYQLVVMATDNGDTPLSGSAGLTLRVLNCTPNTITFVTNYFYFEIDEGSFQFRNGSNIILDLTPNSGPLAFTPDYSENPFQLTFNFLTLKDSASLDSFGIGQGLGLDREVRELYTVIVSTVPQTAYASVTVRVLDINDNAPQFSSELYIFSARENTSSPIVVGSTTAMDLDTGANANITYSIVAVRPPSNSFAIDAATGEITTTTELDRESVQQYNLTVQASDGTLTDTTQVIVNVDDINDCDPMFDQPSYTIPVLENLPAGSSIATVTATDCDIGNNALLQYTVVAGDIGVFSLDRETGVVTTLTPLDFEVESEYYLNVIVTDMGLPFARTGQVDLTIQVQDFNDCPPLFDNVQTSLTVLEDAPDGTVLVTFEVTDCDSGLNGENGTRFTIIAGNTGGAFDLTPVSGLLITTQSLDREVLSNYVLSIQAQDSAGVNSLSSVTQLSINVGDVNDNSPVFSESQILITIRENEDTDSSILIVTATDIDQGLNSDVLYSLLNDEGVFDVDEGTGSISLVQSLDRETTDSYNLTVIARDRADEPRSSNLTIFVTVSDVNDNSPVIFNVTSGVTMVNVIEGTDIGTAIFLVSATDQDAGSNGEVSFTLEDLSPNLPFEISPTGGVISVTGSLDYETQNEYTVVVIATDNGSPQRLSTVATLTIDIDDSNDNAPTFTTALFEGTQSEGVAPGTSILVVIAMDADQTGTPNAEIEFSLLSGDVEAFNIDRDTGVISNRIVLDRENRSQYSLTVLANNSQSHTPLYNTTSVAITVLDVNDEVPVFDDPSYTATLRELTPTGSPVITVSAKDNDKAGTPNSDLVYSLARQTNNPFGIDQNTGEVVLLNSLDFETTTSYALTLVVEDKGTGVATSTAQLVVSIIDENDVLPEFTLDAYAAEVSEGVVSLPYRVINLAYTDGDTLTAFRESTFSILEVQPPSPGLFYIMTDSGSETGAVYMNRTVDFETQQMYTLSLSVENNLNGTGPTCEFQPVCTFSQTSTLEITITDENDNSPTFTQQVYRGEVSSTASTGTSILSVLATDQDRGETSGSVIYSLGSSLTLPFRIEATTGTLLTRGLLADIPSGSEFDLTVLATDNNGNPQSNSVTAMILVVVLDDFDRIAFEFLSGVDCVVRNEAFFVEYLSNVTGYTIVLENYLEYTTDTSSLFVIHALDENNVIVDFAQFTDRIRNVEGEIQRMFSVCNLTRIISFAEAEEPYEYPPLVDTETIVILVLCLLLIVGSSILLVMALTQRYLALNNARHKLLADVFYGGSPGGGSVVDNVQQENYQLETLELTGKSVNRQNPMFVHPYDNWAGVDTSGVESVEGASSLQRDNPLYESQEIRMEMFADLHSDEEEADDAELLAQALAEDEDDDDEENAVTAI